MPEFISLLRWIRDTAYVEIKTAYDTYLTISVGSTTNIDPIAGVVQPATVTYDPLTGELDFGIPTSPIVDNTDASLIRANGTIPMDPTYVPAVAKDVATKESSELAVTNSIVKIDADSDLHASGELKYRVLEKTLLADVTQIATTHGITNAYTNHRVLDIRVTVDSASVLNGAGEAEASGIRVASWTVDDTSILLTFGALASSGTTYTMFVTYV